MSPGSRGKLMVWLRRLVQGLCLAAFLWLLWAARVPKGEAPSSWLRVFFDADPLIALATWLSAHELPAFPLLAIITVVVTVLLGRVFCGWVCPLGTVHNMASWFRRLLRKKRGQRDTWSRWQRVKYFLLAALLVMAVFGAHWIGVFDPISQFYRVTATTLHPGAQYLVEDGSTAVYQSDPHVGPVHMTSVTEPVYQVLRDHVFVTERYAFQGATLIFLIFMACVLLNLYRPRFWCRYICPLGALLGACSKRPALRLVQDEEACTNCGLCTMKCPAAADPDKPGEWRPTECFGCWNCVTACKRNAIDFKVRAPLTRATEAKLDVSKRALLTAGAGGLGGLVAFRLSPEAQAKEYNPGLIRPPGARPEREFLKRCLQCGLCMKACPTNGLQPALFEAGLEGVWTPVLVPRIGYCEYNCNLCGQVCPTAAIEPLALADKKLVKTGLASFDITRCIPYAYNRDCMVCEEHCPLPKKAIYFTADEVTLRNGSKGVIKRPHVDPDLCIGCGVCEWACVFKDRPAIRVTSANESRHPDNHPMLAGGFDFGTPSSGGLSEDTYGAQNVDPYQAENGGSSSGGSDPYGQ